MHPVYDSPFNLLGLGHYEDLIDVAQYSTEDLRLQEINLLRILERRQMAEPKKKRARKLEYDYWVRSVGDIICDLELVRDELSRRMHKE